MKLSDPQLNCLNSLVHRDTVPADVAEGFIVTDDVHEPYCVATRKTAQSLAKRGLVNWTEGSRRISITHAGRSAVS
jgi:hypothetical protein